MKQNYYDIDIEKIPNHIAIIMDGNGRWAKSKFMPRTYGHKVGVETIRKIVKECSRLGVKYLTLYAFSTENWKRPQEEVSALMGLLVTYLKNELDELHKNNVKILTIGDISKLPDVCVDELEKSIEKTKNNTGVTLSLALNYGSRDDIKKAVREISKDVSDGKISVEDIDDEMISKHLYTKNIIDPDLVIRTSGEQRLSNFLLWEIAYSEFYFTDIHWPDFDEENLQKAIYSYQKRDRRFGAVK
ncbi:isoprenyl transferase [Peptostreptococcus anaerobius]|uniref:Isoprenyl transferase n=1 Tax=Peptostreptococcus porci TaxID=2652282 RepID=A0A6N7WZ11_9FIRM|nr:isoprenyl transferase [Peptostreptococcus porci]MDD7182794.1 isoprenyl transferase [Peptostreptococcus porci]MDY5963866.1 isoprenyl transferase [Peptostreptococcus porci]MST61920.1 isoprenyl transferase [Peptostreptococcus porci]